MSKQNSKKTQNIRSDRGGEYINDKLQIFLKDEDILIELTCPYTSHQNGVAERKNRYLTEMLRTMLADADLKNKYLGEAVMTANHLQNR